MWCWKTIFKIIRRRQKQRGYSTPIETQPFRSIILGSCKMPVADILVSVVLMCVFNIQVRIIYSTNPLLCTEMTENMKEEWNYQQCIAKHVNLKQFSYNITNWNINGVQHPW
jgi:hypothetical protein